jgi:peptidoglycan hydrolase CwlO-like protein
MNKTIIMIIGLILMTVIPTVLIGQSIRVITPEGDTVTITNDNNPLIARYGTVEDNSWQNSESHKQLEVDFKKNDEDTKKQLANLNRWEKNITRWEKEINTCDQEIEKHYKEIEDIDKKISDNYNKLLDNIDEQISVIEFISDNKPALIFLLLIIILGSSALGTTMK